MLSLSRQSLWLPCALGHGNLLERPRGAGGLSYRAGTGAPTHLLISRLGPADSKGDCGKGQFEAKEDSVREGEGADIPDR